MYTDKSTLWTDITDDMIIRVSNWKLILTFKIITSN